MDKFLIPMSTPSSTTKRTREDISSPAPSVDLPNDLLTSSLQEPSWRKLLAPQLTAPYFDEIRSFLASRRERKITVYPPIEEVFTAFNLTPFDQVRVVLIGQDPYIRPGQAHGLCFSVKPPTPPPPSLVNMYKELATDIPGFKAPKHGYLESWARQGILMLNATMTVDEGKSNSHATAIPWQRFTDAVIDLLNRQKSGLVFILWGGFAQKKCKSVDAKRHRVIKCAHPSPLSATAWWGNRSFSRCNAILRELGQQPIDWHLPETAVMVSPSLPLAQSPARSAAGIDRSAEPLQKAQRLMHSLDKSQNPCLSEALISSSSPSSSATIPSTSPTPLPIPSSTLLPSSSSMSSSSSMQSSSSMSTSSSSMPLTSNVSTIEMDELMMDTACIAALIAPCSPIDLTSSLPPSSSTADSSINSNSTEEIASLCPTEDSLEPTNQDNELPSIELSSTELSSTELQSHHTELPSTELSSTELPSIESPSPINEVLSDDVQSSISHEVPLDPTPSSILAEPQNIPSIISTDS